MKRFNKGFTLAEVLVTLTVIGVVSALTLPSTLSNYQTKLVGVKLSKFAAQLENMATSYVAENDTFSTSSQVTRFINKTYLIKDIIGGADGSGVRYSFDKDSSPIAMLKDGTGLQVSMNSDKNFKEHSSQVDIYKVGAPKFDVRFYPNVKGLPSFAQKNFDFTVTELGYVYPKDNDNCLWLLYNNEYTTNGDVFSEGSACVANTTGSGNTNSDYSKFEDIINSSAENLLNKDQNSSSIEQELDKVQSVINQNISRSYNTFSK